MSQSKAPGILGALDSQLKASRMSGFWMPAGGLQQVGQGILAGTRWRRHGSGQSSRQQSSGSGSRHSGRHPFVVVGFKDVRVSDPTGFGTFWKKAGHYTPIPLMAPCWKKLASLLPLEKFCYG